MKPYTLRRWLDMQRGRGAELAWQLGVSRQFVMQMASGQRPIPARLAVLIETLTRIKK